MILPDQLEQDLFNTLTRDGTKSFLRIYTGEEAFWISDYPLKTDENQTAQMEHELWKRGIRTFRNQRGLWLLEPELSYYQAAALEKERLPVFWRSEEELMPVLALMNLLLAHPSDISEEPIEDMRLLLKSCKHTQTLSVNAAKLLRISAFRLRGREPISYHCGCFLKNHLEFD